MDDQSLTTADHVVTTSRKVPDVIKLRSHVYDLAFHPSACVVATGEISGTASLFNFSCENGSKKLLSFKHHKKACRSLAFSTDGNRLYTCSKDKSLHAVDMNSGAHLHNEANAHPKAVNTLKILSENYMATGGDDGSVKIWDTRAFATIAEFSECKDYISAMDCDKDSKTLLCTSGDGHLLVYNLRKKKLEQKSDQLEEELLSMAVVKGGQKVVCGSNLGTLNMYSWNEWGDVSDRIPTEAESIDSLCRVTEDVICTGGNDGVIRSLYLYPHRAIGVLGRHGEFSVESVKNCPHQELIGTCSGDQTVKFWDSSPLLRHLPDSAKQKRKQRKRKLDVAACNKDDFFAEL